MNKQVGRSLSDKHVKRHRTSFPDTQRTLRVKRKQTAIIELLLSIGRVTLKMGKKLVSRIISKLGSIRGKLDSHIEI